MAGAPQRRRSALTALSDATLDILSGGATLLLREALKAEQSTRGNRAARREAARTLNIRIRQRGKDSADLIRKVQERTVELAHEDARAQLARRVPELRANKLQEIATTGPLRDVLVDHAGAAADEVTELLTRAAAQGRSPESVARQIERVLGGGTTPTGLEARTLLIARTELARADRTALLETWKQDEIVLGWMWKAELTLRTCPMCWAMHGTVHRLTEPMGTHPACRCIPVPLEFGAERLVFGAEQFEELDDEDQDVILRSPTRARLYRAGRITLDENRTTGLVGKGTHPEWGPTRFVRPLKDYGTGPT